ncbi:hypothetical protein HHI36_022309 [Cryptolaemus montrouzieri]|uniref:Uncharacterized protein n=1 Tax=Cryptolaemus montrouzieri TaxID=559131 RepID=A0ABD2MZL2_9CUCU
MFPLPVPHTEDTTLFSYIEPDKPYIIISNNKYYYDYLDHLDNCLEFTPAKWLCKRISTIKKITLDIENCEVQLLNNNHMKNLPKSCKTKNFIAELEIWHKLKFNKWFYNVTFPTQLSIVCQDKSTVTERIDKLGILELQPNCKAFTSNVILEIETYIGTDELSNVLPSTNINQEDCCKYLKKNISLNGIKLEPIKLANLDLKELKYAQHKLNEFDEQLQAQLNKPFIIKRSSWFISILYIILRVSGKQMEILLDEVRGKSEKSAKPPKKAEPRKTAVPPAEATPTIPSCDRAATKAVLNSVNDAVSNSDNDNDMDISPPFF